MHIAQKASQPSIPARCMHLRCLALLTRFLHLPHVGVDLRAGNERANEHGEKHQKASDETRGDTWQSSRCILLECGPMPSRAHSHSRIVPFHASVLTWSCMSTHSGRSVGPIASRASSRSEFACAGSSGPESECGCGEENGREDPFDAPVREECECECDRKYSLRNRAYFPVKSRIGSLLSRRLLPRLLEELLITGGIGSVPHRRSTALGASAVCRVASVVVRSMQSTPESISAKWSAEMETRVQIAGVHSTGVRRTDCRRRGAPTERGRRPRSDTIAYASEQGTLRAGCDA
jgi:hypothetical protein